MRIAQFHTRNEFSDWDAALHTFTFANAVHQGLRRIATPELLKGLFDSALRIYLNRFLNIPPAKLPKPKSSGENNNINNIINNSVVSSSSSTFGNDAKTSLKELSAVLDKQQQINQTGQLVADYIYNGVNPNLHGMLREDRNFHSIQMLEAVFRHLVKTMRIMNMSTFW